MFEEFFTENYSKMKQFTHPSYSLLEVGCRDDRGVLSSRILDFSHMTILDKDRDRVLLAQQAIGKNSQSINFVVADIFNVADYSSLANGFDIVMTTALVHHTPIEGVKKLMRIFKKLAKKRIIISGPNAKVQTELYGDHRYHLNREELRDISGEVGLKEVGYI